MTTEQIEQVMRYQQNIKTYIDLRNEVEKELDKDDEHLSVWLDFSKLDDIEVDEVLNHLLAYFSSKVTLYEIQLKNFKT